MGEPQMSVYRLTDKPRKSPWVAVVRQGGRIRRKLFPNQKDASLWEREMRRQEQFKEIPEIARLQEVQALKGITVRDLIADYINAKPDVHPNNIITLNQFARESIAAKSVLDFTEQDAQRWKDKKQKETWKPPGAKGEAKPLTPRTVRRHVNIIRQIFNHA